MIPHCLQVKILSDCKTVRLQSQQPTADSQLPLHVGMQIKWPGPRPGLWTLTVVPFGPVIPWGPLAPWLPCKVEREEVTFRIAELNWLWREEGTAEAMVPESWWHGPDSEADWNQFFLSTMRTLNPGGGCLYPLSHLSSPLSPVPIIMIYEEVCGGKWDEPSISENVRAGKQGPVDLYISGQPDLQKEFQGSQDYTKRNPVSNAKKQTTTKGVMYLNREFLKEEIKMAKKYL